MLLQTNLRIVLLFLLWLMPSLGIETQTNNIRWRNLQVISSSSSSSQEQSTSNNNKQKKKKKQRRNLVRGEKKEKEDSADEEKGGKKKLANRQKCNRDRKSVTVNTVFDSSVLSPLATDSTEGILFAFEGDYVGNWTQTSIEVTEDIILGHDHLIFYDSYGEIVGAITTQFDATVNFAIVTGGYGIFACAQGSPTLEMYEDGSTMVNVVWDLCVCYD
jgi:hypothetical protein